MNHTPTATERAHSPIELPHDTDDRWKQGQAVGRVVLKRRKARPFFAHHPWVYHSAIGEVEGQLRDGDVVDVCNERGEFIARGIYNSRSRLRVRLYTWNADQGLDAEFWTQRFRRAIELRHQLGAFQPQRATRLIYSEADGLSGLIIDKYDNHLVAQINSLAIGVRWHWLAPLLTDTLELFTPSTSSIVVRCDKSVSADEGLPSSDPYVMDGNEQPPITIMEHGLAYEVDLLRGQKTGCYLDQSDNHVAVAKYMRDRRVLDLFCYAGAFGLNALARGGAREVIGVDSNKHVISVAQQNAANNRLTNIQFETSDAFDYLRGCQEQGQRFGAVILDPPKFARTRSRIEAAMRAYHRLNSQAVDVLEPNGILATCSCSGGVSRELFLSMLADVACRAGRDIQVLEQRGAAADHPVSSCCPESDYLKCFICRVS
ncbi:MAG: class I SAM-dependent rRNA methyltransferase [Pirellulaceae bacterium]|nr:class I SAM-dependent rRNA methyltransferase [Planctomycetales bacterium]